MQNNQEKTPSPQLHSDRQPQKKKIQIYLRENIAHKNKKPLGNLHTTQRGSAGNGLLP